MMKVSNNVLNVFKTCPRKNSTYLYVIFSAFGSVNPINCVPSVDFINATNFDKILYYTKVLDFESDVHSVQCDFRIGENPCSDSSVPCQKVTVRLYDFNQLVQLVKLQISLQIDLINVNDNYPEILIDELEVNIIIPEGESNDTILLFNAVDADNLGPLTFSFEDSGQESPDFPFSLVNNTGVNDSVWLKVDGDLLDYEQQLLWRLKVVVKVRELLTFKL
jgi:hypothetical protein